MGEKGNAAEAQSIADRAVGVAGGVADATTGVVTGAVTSVATGRVERQIDRRLGDDEEGRADDGPSGGTGA